MAQAITRAPITTRRYCTGGLDVGWHQLIIVFLPGISTDRPLVPSSSLPRPVDRQTLENCETRATNTKRDDRWGGINKNFRGLEPKSFFEEYPADVSSYPIRRLIFSRADLFSRYTRVWNLQRAIFKVKCQNFAGEGKMTLIIREKFNSIYFEQIKCIIFRQTKVNIIWDALSVPLIPA